MVMLLIKFPNIKRNDNSNYILISLDVEQIALF